MTDEAICGACAVSREDSVTIPWDVGRQLVTASEFILLALWLSMLLFVP